MPKLGIRSWPARLLILVLPPQQCVEPHLSPSSMTASLKTTPAVFGLLILITTLSTFYHSTSTSQRVSIGANSLGLELNNATSRRDPWDSSKFLLGGPKRRYKGQRNVNGIGQIAETAGTQTTCGMTQTTSRPGRTLASVCVKPPTYTFY